MRILIKMGIKLLLRNKVFLFFLLVIPVFPAYILHIKMDYSFYSEGPKKETVLELKSYEDKAVYAGETSTCIVKVYDASKSDLSEYILHQMTECGMFSICRADVCSLTETEVHQIAERDAFNDRAGMLLYLKTNFDEAVLSGEWEEGIKSYIVSEDERQNIFITELKELLIRIKQVQSTVGNDTGLILEVLEAVQKELPQKRLVNFAGKDEIVLTQQQTNQKAQIGYAFAIITLGFLFCGVCVAHSVIEEQNNKVFTRIMLTEMNGQKYFLSKFVLTLIISLLQTGVLAVCLICMKTLDVGMSLPSFLLIIFLLGLIFSTISLLFGVIIGDVMSSNYAVFSIWSISALLAGLYFPLDDTTKALKTLSYLMPQKWFMDASELLLAGDKSAYSMVLCVTVAYLIVIISVGGVVLKSKKYE